jgi:glycosyltransferase involved in cell wall biosynthesis
MKKLVYYSDCFVFGGCEKLLLNLITNQEINDRYDVHYVYARNSDYQKGVDRDVPITVRRHPLSILANHNLFYQIDRSGLNKFFAFCLKIPFAFVERTGIYAFYNFLRLLLFFKKLKPDLLHINNGGYPAARSCLVAVVSARVAGVPKIVFAVNNLAQKQKNVVEKLVDRYIDSHVDRFVTASSFAGKTLVANREFTFDKVIQILNGIPADNPKKWRSDLLTGFGISPEKFVIVSVALLTERKGQMCLLKALNDIRKSCRPVFEDTILFLVGDGEDRPLIDKYIIEHGMMGLVILTGHRDDYFDFIHAADLFVLPSLRDEDMPLVILSAMSCGKAIVSTRVAGIVEQIRDGIDGVLINPGDIVALATAITRFYSDRTLGASCGARARGRFEDCFSLDRFIENYLTLYGELIHE